MTPCVEWPKARTPDGYGQQWRDGRVLYAHRLAWEDAHGPVPAGLWVLHHCDNPSCVNVDHLFLGTIGDNNRDMWQKGRGRIPDAHGEHKPSAKLTQAQVSAIRADGRVLRLVAADYGVSISTISQIRRGEKWRAAS